MSWAEDMGIDSYSFIDFEESRQSAIKNIKNHIKELKEELIRRKVYPFTKPSDFIWETKYCERIPVGEMEESHIINCIKFCERKIKEINEYFDSYYDDEDVKFEPNLENIEVEDTENN